jgi:hypothetical protein
MIFCKGVQLNVPRWQLLGSEDRLSQVISHEVYQANRNGMREEPSLDEDSKMEKTNKKDRN